MHPDPRAFATRYRGPHAPEDALHWLTFPDQPGPTGALPPQQEFLDLADEFTAAGDHAAAQAALEAAAALLAHYRRQTLEAL